LYHIFQKNLSFFLTRDNNHFKFDLPNPFLFLFKPKRMAMMTGNNCNLNNFHDVKYLETKISLTNLEWASGNVVIYRDTHAKDVRVVIDSSWMKNMKRKNQEEQRGQEETDEITFTLHLKLQDESNQTYNPIIKAPILSDTARRSDNDMIRAHGLNIPKNHLAFKRRCDDNEPELILLKQNGKSFQLSSKFKSNSMQRGQKQFLTFVMICVPIINNISRSELAVRSPLFTVRSKKTELKNPNAKTRVRGKEVEAEQVVEQTMQELCFAIKKKTKAQEEMDLLFEKLSFIKNSMKFLPNANRLNHVTNQKIEQVYMEIINMNNSVYKKGWQDKQSDSGSSSSVSSSMDHCSDESYEATSQLSTKRSRTSYEAKPNTVPSISSSNSDTVPVSTDDMEMDDDTDDDTDDDNIVGTLMDKYL